jgi:type II secretory pathway pseudopilin PulG
MPSDTDAETRRIPGYGATRLPGRVRRGLLRTVVTGVVVLVVAVLALLGVRSLTSWPFGDKEIDRSGPAVLTAMRDLSEYHAAAGQYQVVIDIEQDAKFLPDIIKGKRTIFLAIGSVDAYVDFRQLGDDAVSISDDRRTVSLTLPRAQLSKPNVDPEQSRVLNQDLGVIDRLGGLFSDEPNPQNQQMYVLAQQRLSDAATQVGLQKRAEDNTKATLEKLMRSLGFTTVNIKFVDSAAGG